MRYFYNENTHRLHIVGFCFVSNCLPYNVKYFSSENEALAYDGKSVGMCKICQKKLEKEIEKITMELKD